MSKRGRKPKSGDDKSPQTAKERQKQGNLYKFLKIQNKVHINNLNTIKQEYIQSNSMSIDNSKYKAKMEEKTRDVAKVEVKVKVKEEPQGIMWEKLPFQKTSLTPEQQQRLTNIYLNPNLTFTCLSCSKDITNSPKIHTDKKALCIACGSNLIQPQFTVIKCLDNETLDDFQRSRLYKEKNQHEWTLRDELLLVQSVEKHGIESYQLIKKNMRTRHTVEEIRDHQRVIVREVIRKQHGGKGLMRLDEQRPCHVQTKDVQRKGSKALIQEQAQVKSHNFKRSYTNIEDQLANKSTQKDPVKQKFLKVLGYNQKRDEFESHHSNLFHHLLSQIDTQDYENDPQFIQFIYRGYENYRVINQSQQRCLRGTKILKGATFHLQKKSMGKGSDRSECNQNNMMRMLRHRHNQQQEQEQKWRDMQQQIKQKYMMFDQGGHLKAKKLAYKMKLIDRLVEISKQAQEQLNQLSMQVDQDSQLQQQPQGNIQRFNSLPSLLLEQIYKTDEVRQIQMRLKGLNEDPIFKQQHMQIDREEKCETNGIIRGLRQV